MSDLTADAEKSHQIKIALRVRLLTARRSLSDSVLVAAAAQVQDQLLALVRRTGARDIAAYVPVGSEPGGPDLPERLAAALPRGGRLLLPVLLPDNDLDWAVYTGALETAARGLLEPGGPRLGVEAVRGVDLLVVPALAVGDDGIRMGRGGGSYDRVLSRLAGSGPALTGSGPAFTGSGPAGAGLTVALLHDGEALPSVPADPHDRPVQAVVTPSGGFSTRPAPPRL